MRITVAALMLSVAGPLAADDFRPYPIPHRIPNAAVVPRVKYPGIVAPPVRPAQVRRADLRRPAPARLAVPPLPVRLISAERIPPTRVATQIPPFDCPVAIPRVIKPVGTWTALAREWKKPPAGPLATATIPLKNITASQANLRIHGHFATKAGPTTPKPTIVPDQSRNAIHIIGTKKQLEQIRDLLAKCDVAKKKYLIQTTIIEVSPDGKTKTIARPKVATFADSPARVHIAIPGRKVLDLTLRFHSIKPSKDGVRVYSQPQPPIARPRPMVIHGLLPSVSTTRVRLLPASAKRLPPPEAPKKPILVKVYAVADLLAAEPKTPRDQREAALNSLSNVIRNSVYPQSWSGKNATGKIIAQPRSYSLIVRHTEEGHKLVANVLAHLRKVRDKSRKK